MTGRQRELVVIVLELTDISSASADSVPSEVVFVTVACLKNNSTAESP